MNDLILKAVMLVLCVAAPFVMPHLPVGDVVRNGVLLAACLVGPYALAGLLAGLLRLPKLLWKMAVIFYGLLFAMPLLRLPDSMKLGIDLSGGTILVYEIDATKLGDRIRDPELMTKMVAAIIKRINPGGVEDVTVRPVGSDRLEVIVPGSDPQEVSRYRRLITDLGNLEFRFLANRRKPELRRWIQDTEPGGNYPFPEDVLRRDHVVARWFPASLDEAKKKHMPERTLAVISKLSGVPVSELSLRTPLSELVARGMSLDAMFQALSEAFKDQNGARAIPLADRERMQRVADVVQYLCAADTMGLHGDIAWHFNPDPQGGLMLLVVQPLEEGEERDRQGLRFPAVTGEYLRRATPQTDQDGSLAVGFVLDGRGAILFRNLTNAYKPEQDGFMSRLAILLNNQVQSAPNLKQPITDGSGQISGGSFTQDEIDDLIAVLNAGALPAALNTQPASQYQIGPTLGTDTIQKGAQAIIGAMCVVLVFMVIYYWFAGSVADVALLLNLLMTLGVMSLIQANLTLPGLAGLVLSVGMSVDANVLIFERMREEQARGATFRMAIRNGFDRATSAIVDSNVTTLLTAVILYSIGTDQVKGFAVTLILGILMSMYAALYVSRLVFTVAEQKRWLRGFSAMDWVGKPSLDFIGKLKYCLVASLALIVVGMGAFFGRGVAATLDIDFTGGTQVLVRFNEPQRSEDVRAALAELPDLSVAELRIGEEQEGLRFDVRTSEQDVDAVTQQIGTIFGDRLARVHMQFQRVGKEADAEGAAARPAADANGQQADAPGGGLKEPPQGGRRQWRLTFDNPLPLSVVEESFNQHIESSGLQNVNASFAGMGEAEAGRTLFSSIQLSTADVPAAEVEKLLGEVQKSLAADPIFEQTLNFGGRVAHDMQVKALWAMLLSFAGIIAYLWIRFQKVYFGIAAVIALIHDVLITLGLVALSYWLAVLPGMEQFKINLPMIAGFLTLIGYSLNDTIITFDRLREVRGKSRDISAEMINVAVNQTLSRTLLTSFTTFVVVAILYFAGGEGVRGFAFCLVVGLITGTYSSIYIASPMLLWLSKQPFFAGPEHRRLETAGR